MKLSLATATVALVTVSFAPIAWNVGCAARPVPVAHDARAAAEVEPAAPSAVPHEARAPRAPGDLATLGHEPELDVARSDRRAKEALDRLSPLGAIRDAPRGIVVRLASSSLFEGATADLMPSAHARLDRVAQALHEANARSIAVRGHTDRSGDDERDLALSRRRAAAVRAYLISRGVPADDVRAEGLGSSEPATSNASTEGRAENRRVEIVVEDPDDPA